LTPAEHNNEQTDSPTDLEYNECQIEAQEFVYFPIRRTISLFVVVLADFPRELDKYKEVTPFCKIALAPKIATGIQIRHDN
jgi:hypothetical protein